jgi:hypothetical protein
VDSNLLNITLPKFKEFISQVTYNYNLRKHSSTLYAPFELYYKMKINNIPHLYPDNTFKLINGICGKELSNEEVTEMNAAALANQQSRAMRNYNLRWRKYKQVVKEKLIVEDTLVLVKPIIQPSHLDKKSILFHACARVHKILEGTDFCKLEWITNGPG